MHINIYPYRAPRPLICLFTFEQYYYGNVTRHILSYQYKKTWKRLPTVTVIPKHLLFFSNSESLQCMNWLESLMNSDKHMLCWLLNYYNKFQMLNITNQHLILSALRFPFNKCFQHFNKCFQNFSINSLWQGWSCFKVYG